MLTAGLGNNCLWGCLSSADKALDVTSDVNLSCHIDNLTPGLQSLNMSVEQIF